MENKIIQVEANNLSEYRGDLSSHQPFLVLNEYPTIQWIGGLPDYYVVDSVSLRPTISLSIIATGRGSMNGIYLGKFSGDALEYQISKEDPNNLGSYTLLNRTDGTQIADIPITIYNSFGHFVRGMPSTYSDYFYTLRNLDFVDEYIYVGFQIHLKISASINLLTLGDVQFESSTIEELSYSDNDLNNARTYYKLRGNFKDLSGNRISTKSEFFSQNLEVGMCFLLQWGSDTSKRIAQLCEFTGDGTKDAGVCLLIRDFETEDNAGNIQETPVATLSSSASIAGSGIQYNYNETLTIEHVWTSLRIGLLQSGYVEEFPNPQTGMSRSYKDYSKRNETIDGGLHPVNRNIGKSYNGRITMDRDRVRRFLSFAEYQRAKPFPVEILTHMEEETPTVFYGYFVQPPNENFSYRTGIMKEIDFTIQQVF